jgi:hydrogenase nickel incorporation protein HypA/HybF
MHEYSLVEALVDRVAEEARRRGAVAVHAVTVRVGELSGVDAELFRTAYETFRAGTVCARAALTVRAVAATWSCPRCLRPILRGEVLRCPDCRDAARLDEGGDALTLDRIEMEVP